MSIIIFVCKNRKGKQLLQIPLSAQLDCHLSARLHRVFGCDLSVDSQLQCILSAVTVDCFDNCSQLG